MREPHFIYTPLQGVTTANPTNKYQKYKSVGLGDQLQAALNTMHGINHSTNQDGVQHSILGIWCQTRPRLFAINPFLFPPLQSWLGYMQERSPVKRCSLTKDASGFSDVKIHSNSSISAKTLESNTAENEKRFPSEFIVPPDLCRNHLVPKRIHRPNRPIQLEEKGCHTPGVQEPSCLFQNGFTNPQESRRCIRWCNLLNPTQISCFASG